MISGEAARLGEEAASRLAQAGQCEIGPGLADAEFARVERDYGFEFADDHRAFLAAGLPLRTRTPYERRNPWPDWRHGRRRDLRKILHQPVEGALFDVEYNALWHPSWGQRPAQMSTALDTARRHLARAPKMIPVYRHRYLPAGRGTYGHPVLSIWQTDIIMFGTDLADYIAIEFHRRSMIPDLRPPPGWTEPPMVPFWSDFLPQDLRKPGHRSSGLPGSVGREPADLAGSVPGHGGEQLAVGAGDPQRGVAGFDGDDAPGVRQADRMRWRATWMPPRLDTFRWMIRLAGGSGCGPARRTPCSLCRWPGGIGQGRVRHKMPSWVMKPRCQRSAGVGHRLPRLPIAWLELACPAAHSLSVPCLAAAQSPPATDVRHSSVK